MQKDVKTTTLTQRWYNSVLTNNNNKTNARKSQKLIRITAAEHCKEAKLLNIKLFKSSNRALVL